ncbi:MAG: single-stranded DNA-binding protein, partial [Sporomusa sp.]
GKNPDVRYTQSGKCVASFDLAVNRFGGGEKNTADWIPIVAWEKTGEVVGNNLVKGSRCLVEGRIQIRSYEAKDGQKRRVTEVVAQAVEFLDNKRHSDPETEDPFKSFGKDVFPGEEIPF